MRGAHSPGSARPLRRARTAGRAPGIRARPRRGRRAARARARCARCRPRRGWTHTDRQARSRPRGRPASPCPAAARPRRARAGDRSGASRPARPSLAGRSPAPARRARARPRRATGPPSRAAPARGPPALPAAPHSRQPSRRERAAAGPAAGSNADSRAGSYSRDALAGGIHVGHGRVVDAVRGRGAGLGLVGLGARGSRRRSPVTATASRRATPRTSALFAELGLTHHRLSIEWARHRARARRAATRARSRTTATCSPRRATPASRRGSACTTSRCRAGSRRRRLPASSGTGPARGRGTSTSSPRRSAISSRGWQPVNETNFYAVRARTAAAGLPPGHDDRGEWAAATEAIHLATAEAAVRLKQTGAPVASIFALVAAGRAGRLAGDAPHGRAASTQIALGDLARPVPRRRAARARPRAGRAPRPRRARST